MKITFNNKTHWRSDHIRAFIAHELKDERPDLCKRGAPALKVKVTYTRRAGSSYSSGCAYLNSNWMNIRLSKHTPDKVELGHVIAHELAHTRGMNHDKMRGNSRYSRVGSYREVHAWANDLPLERVEKKSRKKPVDLKLTHAQKMLKAALTREKRAITLRKKWAAKVKYYTKKGETPRVVNSNPFRQTLGEWVEARGFRLEGSVGDYEVSAPDGFNLGDGTHSRLCTNAADVRTMVDSFCLQLCSEGCDCMENNTDQTTTDDGILEVTC